MNRAVAHRGPDDAGVWSDRPRGIFLGHQRLSILDLSARGHQPMHGTDGSSIVFNGEIYNYKEIRKQFEPTSFHSDTDTEVLLRLHERDGLAGLTPLNGMFAFALWSPSSDKLFLARDRLGKKPLYYTTMNGIFAFSSEIKALLQLEWVKAELDEEALYHFLTFNKLSPPKTMFRGIQKFHPAHFMIVGRSGIEQYAPYWDVSYQAQAGTSEAFYCQQVDDRLRESVRKRMVSDVPVGAFLSGGVDSSAIVALMSEFASGPVRTFSIGFADAPAYDEREHAERIARKFRTDHHEKIVSRDEIVQFLPKIVEIYDEPLADATSIPLYFLSQMARATGTKVVLTGDGSDELFCGYGQWLRYAQVEPAYRLIAGFAPFRAAAAGLARLLDANSPFFELLSRASRRQEFFWVEPVASKSRPKRTC